MVSIEGDIRNLEIEVDEIKQLLNYAFDFDYFKELIYLEERLELIGDYINFADSLTDIPSIENEVNKLITQIEFIIGIHL